VRPFLLLIPVLVSPAWACTTPVFRYALERWDPDPYEVVVTHRGPLDEKDEAAVAALRKAVEGPPSPNALVSVVDPSADAAKPTEAGEAAVKEDVAAGAAEGVSEGARLAVRYPRILGIQDSAWEGPLSGVEPGAFFDSPARKEIARLILSGDSAVWMLLESGDKEKDEAAAKTLASALEGVKGKLKLPEQPPDAGIDPFGGMIGGPPLKMAFSMLRVSRSDPAEAMLVQFLLRSDANLRDAKDPIAFPIFGRGRALCALMGEQLDEATIEEVCSFLIGWCSCEVKAQNPGIDLLMTADWNGAFRAEMLQEIELPSPAAAVAESAPDPKPEPEATASPDAVKAASEAAPETPAPAAPEPVPAPLQASTPSSPLVRNILIAAGAALLLVVAASLALRRRTAS